MADAMTGGGLLVKSLHREGVRCVFALCGQSVSPIFDACLDHGIRILDTRTELAAAYMADAWGRLTRHPGVCVTTGGPGFANALAGLATAHFANSPMILIAGHSDVALQDRKGFQEMDQEAMARPACKWSRTVWSLEAIPPAVQAAFRTALTGPPGPVHLSLPRDLLKAASRAAPAAFPAPARYRPTAGPAGDPDAARAAMHLLAAAHRPVIIAGSGVWWSDAGELLCQFVTATQIPLFWKDLDTAGEMGRHPLDFGLASAWVKGVHDLIAEADAVLLLGVELDSILGYGRPPVFHPSATTIHVASDPASIGRNREIDVGIVGECGPVLAQLLAGAAAHSPWGRPAWIARLQAEARASRAAWTTEDRLAQKPIHPYRLCCEVARALRPDDIVVVDGGDARLWANLAVHPAHPGWYLQVGPIGGIGHGVPYALAAKLAFPDRRVVLITGDGALGYGIMEYDTAVRHDLPFVAVVSSDGTWGIVRHDQIHEYGAARSVGTALGLTHYEGMVATLGGYGEFVEAPEQIGPAMDRAFASGRPACVNVPVRSTNPIYEDPATGELRY